MLINVCIFNSRKMSNFIFGQMFSFFFFLSKSKMFSFYPRGHGKTVNGLIVLVLFMDPNGPLRKKKNSDM